MSAFTDFIQVELPKRPYLESDVPQNSVIIRNGAGPRQLDGIQLLPGQIIMNIGGTIQAVALEDVSGNTDNFVQEVSVAAAQWTLAHGGGSENVLVALYDSAGRYMIPDEITIVDDNTITVDFGSPIDGKAVVLYF